MGNEKTKQLEIHEETEKLFKTLNISAVPVSSQKISYRPWKEFQHEIAPWLPWYDQLKKSGNIGIITGRISGNLEVIDIDVKNDPYETIFEEYRTLIPVSLYKKLLIQATPNKGYHFIYRCPDIIIPGSQKLALHENKEVILETRGEGGYACHHLKDYEVIQGTMDLLSLKADIPIITLEERDLLLTLARSLNRSKEIKEFKYSEPAINVFNEDFDILSVFEDNGWSCLKEETYKIIWARPDSATPYSVYYYTDTKVFMCFSSSTSFQVQKPYNHFQVLQVLEGEDDYKKTLSLLPSLGYETKAIHEKSGKKKISADEIAGYLNNNGVRYDTFIQDIICNGKIITEMVYNTLFIDMKKHFEEEIARTKFEEVIKSDYIKKYNPILSFVEKNKDIKPNASFEKWLDCIKLKNPDVSKSTILHFFKKWYVGIIAQALEGEYPNEFFLTLLGVEQGVGKTTMLRKYTLPKELQKYQAEHSLSFDDDFKVLMCQSLLVIDDEMDGRTYEAAKTFKTVLSTKRITTRRKYDRRISNIHRRCSFAGSGNNLSIIRERQNRRILPIEIDKIYFEKLSELKLDDLFMEAYHLYQSGYSYSYNHKDKPLLDELYKDYVQDSDIDLIIDDYIELPSAGEKTYFISNLDIVTALTEKFPNSSRRINIPVIGKLMAERGFKKIRKGKRNVTCYEIKFKSKIRLLMNEGCQAWEFNPKPAFAGKSMAQIIDEKERPPKCKYIKNNVSTNNNLPVNGSNKNN